jgi:predicted cation transporter
MSPLLTYLHILSLRARAALQKFAEQEPVRLRTALTSLVIAGGVLVPALANANVAQTISAVGAVVLPVAVGEYTRDKVTPVK